MQTCPRHNSRGSARRPVPGTIAEGARADLSEAQKPGEHVQTRPRHNSRGSTCRLVRGTKGRRSTCRPVPGTIAEGARADLSQAQKPTPKRCGAPAAGRVHALPRLPTVLIDGLRNGQDGSILQRGSLRKKSFPQRPQPRLARARCEFSHRQPRLRRQRPRGQRRGRGLRPGPRETLGHTWATRGKAQARTRREHPHRPHAQQSQGRSPTLPERTAARRRGAPERLMSGAAL